MDRPNVLFILSDEHSHRFFGKHQNHGEEVLTPNLDQLIETGTWFQDAYCQMPLCTPSRISFLTGLEPRKCGAWSNCDVLRPELMTLPGHFAKNGYETCLVGKMHLGGNQQMVGFQHRPYGDLTGYTGHQWEPIDNIEKARSMRNRTKGAGVSQIPEALLQEQKVSQESIAWIRNHRAEMPDKPWFLCASYSRPHFPLTAPNRWIEYYRKKGISRPFSAGDTKKHPMSQAMRKGFQVAAMSDQEMMEARLAYFACVSYFDEIVGDLLVRLEATGELDNTIIVYTSDHGEMAGEHGMWWKNGWFEACTRVPLIISTPEQRKSGQARETKTPVGLLDLFPSLCELSNLPIPEHLDGRSLAPVLRGQVLEDQPVNTDVLWPRWGKGTEFRSVRYKHFKYVRFRNAEPLFFNLEKDPWEQHNIYNGPLDEEATKIREKLKEYASRTMDFDKAEEERTVRDGSLREQYRLNLEAGEPKDFLNCYALPDGRLIHDDEALYNPKVIAKSAKGVLK